MGHERTGPARLTRRPASGGMTPCPSTTHSAGRSARTRCPGSAASPAPRSRAPRRPRAGPRRRSPRPPLRRHRRAGRAGGAPAARAPAAAGGDAELRPSPAPVRRVVRVRRRGGFGCLVGLIILLAIAAVPIIAVVSLVGSAGDTFDEITDVLDSAPERSPRSPRRREPPAPAKPPSGLARRVDGRAGELRQGAEAAGEGGPGRVTYIRLSPDRVDAQLVKGSRQRSASGELRGRADPRPGDRAARRRLGTVAFSEIDRSAPARLVRGSAARYGVREKGINYLVLSADPGEGHAGSPTSRTASTWRATARQGRAADQLTVNVQASGGAPGATTAASWPPGAQPPGGA